MCLVTYLPSENGYILSSNRDEQPERSATTLLKEKIGKYHVTYPKDVLGGSWIFSSSEGKNIVLLNGAFNKHDRNQSWRMSRGLVIKSCFEHTSTSSWLQHFDFSGIEPFTLIIIEGQSFFEFRWDGQLKHIKNLDKTDPYTWSSCTLYDRDMQEKREAYFMSSIQNKTIFDYQDAVDLHNAVTGLPDAYDYIMHRGEKVRTISTSHILYQNMIGCDFIHYNRETDTKSVIRV